ncbi:MAG: thiamine pyrophosphate-dependent enzyme [Patescibacteria group bacterium]|nr:thiamine pyrophosphate-dependent enzyme [Patescibacteria group bacterium]
MINQDLNTKAKITWCPGCPNFQILVAFREAITELTSQNKIKIENIVATAGIGCHGKIVEYLNMNTFTSLHGRSIPTMTGIKTANPNLTVIGFSGDGDAYAEGMEHLIHAARRNSDIKLFVHNNQVFALTTGQATPTSPKGFKGKSTPFGSIDEPFDPILLMLSLNASFIARTFALDIPKTKEIMKRATEHKGFAFVDIIQPCITFFDTREYFKERIFWIDDSPANDPEIAMQKIKNNQNKIPCGIFYEISKPTFEAQQ